MTLVSIPLMDRTGRRTLHLYGLGGMFIFSIFITISFLIKASIMQRLVRFGQCFSPLHHAQSACEGTLPLMLVTPTTTYDYGHESIALRLFLSDRNLLSVLSQLDTGEPRNTLRHVVLFASVGWVEKMMKHPGWWWMECCWLGSQRSEIKTDKETVEWMWWVVAVVGRDGVHSRLESLSSVEWSGEVKEARRCWFGWSDSKL